MKILALLIATITNHSRYFPDFQWSSECWTHNVFRFFGMIFGEYYGIRPSVTTCAKYDKDGNIFYSEQIFHQLEPIIAYREMELRSFLKLFSKITVPILKTPNGFYFPSSPYLFAIAHDTSNSTGNVGGGGGTTTLGHTCTGSNLFALMHANWGSGGGNSLSSPTYNSVTMTKEQEILASAQGNQTSYGLHNPSTGTHNFSLTQAVGGNGFDLCGQSYTGVQQTNDSVDNSRSFTGSSLSSPNNQSITPNTSNSWCIVWLNSNQTIAASTNMSFRVLNDSNGSSVGDSNGAATTAGVALTQSWTWTGTDSQAGNQISIAPFAAASSAVITPLPLRSLLGVGT